VTNVCDIELERRWCELFRFIKGYKGKDSRELVLFGLRVITCKRTFRGVEIEELFRDAQSIKGRGRGGSGYKPSADEIEEIAIGYFSPRVSVRS
jgi:hypothetical protein